MSEIERLAEIVREFSPVRATSVDGACAFIEAEAPEIVRAVLTAMREPSEGMLTAGQKAQWASIQSVHVEGQSVDLMAKAAAVDPDHTRAEWQAMLDHILAEP